MSCCTKHRAEPIAIIGSGCRFPGKSTSPSKLWDLLQQPIDLAADIPNARFNTAGFYHKNGEHPGVCFVPPFLFSTQICVRVLSCIRNVTQRKCVAGAVHKHGWLT